MAGADGLIENYDTGAFLVRPDSKTLSEFKGTNFYKKTTMTACSSGNSAFYYIFFYRNECLGVFVTKAKTKPEINFFFDGDSTKTEEQIFKESLIGFVNPQPTKCPM